MRVHVCTRARVCVCMCKGKRYQRPPQPDLPTREHTVVQGEVQPQREQYIVRSDDRAAHQRHLCVCADVFYDNDSDDDKTDKMTLMTEMTKQKDDENHVASKCYHAHHVGVGNHHKSDLRSDHNTPHQHVPLLVLRHHRHLMMIM